MPAKTAVRGTYAKTAARQKLILDAAFEVFSMKGYAGGSLRDIAERAGVSHGIVLFHFKTKENLLSAVIKMRDERGGPHFDVVTEPGIQGLHALLGLLQANVNDDPGQIALYSVLSGEATSPSHPAYEYVRDRYRRITENIRMNLVAMESKGELQTGVDPDHVARILVAMMDGLQLQWLHDSDVDMVEDVRRFLQSLLTVPLLPPTVK